MNWLSDKHFEKPYKNALSNFMEPKEVKNFHKIVEVLSKNDRPFICGNYFLNNILLKNPKYVEKYKLANELGKLLPLYASCFLSSFDDSEVVKQSVEFIVKSIPFCEQQQSYNEILPQLVHKILESNNKKVLEASIEIIHLSLTVPYLVPLMYRGVSLSRLWESTFVKYQNTYEIVSPLLLQCTAFIGFVTPDSITDLLGTSLRYILANEIPKDHLVSNYLFLSYAVRNVDCTDYLVQIMPRIAACGCSLESLKFFENFLRAPVLIPPVTWTPLSEICASKDATSDVLHNALNAISRSKLVPPQDSFSFAPFAKNSKNLSKEDNDLMFQILFKCDAGTKAEFIKNCFPLEETGVNVNDLMKLVTETQWDKTIGQILNAVITNIEVDTLKKYFTDIPDFFAIANAACDQIYPMCKASAPVLIKLFELADKKFELVTSLISKVLDRASVEVTIPQVVLELEKGAPDFILDTFANASRRIAEFNQEFFRQDYKKALIEATKTLNGIGLISALAIDGPVKEIDNFVEENWDLFAKYDEKVLTNLMFGLPPNSETNGYICIPSIIPHIKNITANTPFDKYLLSKYIKDPTKEQMKLFITHSFSASQLEQIKDDTELLLIATDPTEPHKSVIQFHPHARQCSGSLLFSLNTSLWFYPYEPTGKTTICSYEDKIIELTNDGLVMFGSDPVKVHYKQWNLISIFTQEKLSSDSVVSVYLNGEFVTSTTSATNPSKIYLGAQECSSLWLLSPSIIQDNNKIQQQQEYTQKIFNDGPFVSKASKFYLGNGPKTVPYEGISRHIPALHGKYFIFDELLKCEETDISRFNTLLKTAFNLLYIRVFTDTEFFRPLRYVLFRKDKMYCKEIEDTIFDAITTEDGVKWEYAFSVYSDYRILTSEAINFSFIDRLIECHEYSLHLETFISFVTDVATFFNLSEYASERCFNILEIFVQKNPVLLKNLAITLISIPYNESDEIKPLYDEKQIKRQKKIFKIVTRVPDAFFSIFTPSDAFKLATLLNDELALDLLQCIANYTCINIEYAQVSGLKSLKPLFRRQAKNIRLWNILFVFLTGSKKNTIKEFKEVKSIRVIILPVLFDIIRDIITPETDQMCYDILDTLEFYIGVLKIPYGNYIKKIQKMCSLGFNERSLEQNPFSLSQQEKELRVRRKLSSKQLIRTFEISSKSTTAQFFDEICQGVSSELKPELLKYLHEHEIELEGLEDFNVENDTEIPDDFYKYFELKSAKEISKIATNALIESLKANDGSFKDKVIQLTINGADTAPEIARKMHQMIITELLLREDFLTVSRDQKAYLFEFLTHRIVEGWWEDHVCELVKISISTMVKDFTTTCSEFIIAALSQVKSTEEKLDVARFLVESEVLVHIVRDSTVFASFLCLIISHEISEMENAKSLYKLMASKMQDSELKKALESNKALEWLDSKPNLTLIFQEYYNEIIEQTTASSVNLDKERQYLAFKPRTKRYEYITNTNIAHVTTIRQFTRYKFSMRFNISSLSIDTAIDALFKYRSSISINSCSAERYMYNLSPSPLVPPMKLLRCVINYNVQCKKTREKIQIPISLHKQPFSTNIEELTKDAVGPSCLEGWNLPMFINRGITYVAKTIFHPISPLFPCAMLITPESLKCVGIVTKDALLIIINATIINDNLVLNDSIEMLCHSAVIETAPFGYISDVTMFGNHSVLIYHWNDICTVIPRKYIYENTALDIYTYRGTSITLLVGESDRKMLINKISPPKNTQYTRGPLFYNLLSHHCSLDEVSKMWSQNLISSFEYLLYLNAQGLRSFNDLSQYPVFPWVVGDYSKEDGNNVLRDLSRPLGNIGESRATRYKTMYEETDPHYFYGTHYSYPASVLHFMMRLEPFTLYNVNLHSGFDHKDRLFCNIFESYRSASEANQADLKELIPQFFCIYDMLGNVNNLPLTTRTDGLSLATVKLPVWAKTPREFMWRNRAALESEEAKEKISDWIDLIFGFKQKGQAAVDALNLYHPLTYEDAVLNKDDEHEMKAQIDAINNFGQCPHQIFKDAHIKYTNLDNRQNKLTGEINIAPLKAMQKDVENITVSNGKIFATTKLQHAISQNIVTIKERCFIINDDVVAAEDLFHVKCSSLSNDELFLTLGCENGVVITYLFKGTDFKVVHTTVIEGNIQSIAVSSHLALIIAATDKYLYSIDLSTGYAMKRIELEGVCNISIDETTFFIILTTDETVYAYTQNLDLISSEKCASKITTLSTTDSIVWIEHPFFVTGHEDGNILLWNMDIPNATISNKQLLKTDSSAISAVRIVASGSAVVAINKDGATYLLSSSTVRKQVVKTEYFNTCPICCQALNEKNVKTCPVCGLPACSNCWQGKACTICSAKLSINEKSEEEEILENP